MSDKLAMRGRKAAFTQVAFQALLVLVVTLLCGFGWGIKAAYSAFIGGFIYVVPHFCFAWLAFRHAGARQARSVVSSFYLGEFIKLILTIVFFAMALSMIELEYFSFYLAFTLALMSQWSAPFFFNKNNGMKNGCSR